MLRFLSGGVHEVITAVRLVCEETQFLEEFHTTTRVWFHPLDGREIDAYLERVNPLDKAGAYAAQEDEGQLIERIEGSLNNVIGLPVEEVRDVLRKFFPELSKDSGEAIGES